MDAIFGGTKVSTSGSDEEYMEAQVMIAILYLFWDFALKGNDGFGAPTRGLLRYLAAFVIPVGKDVF